jgi:hypothetical protein
VAATERVLQFESLVDDLKEHSHELVASKSTLMSHMQAISLAAASAVTAQGVSEVTSASPAASPAHAMSPASRDITSSLKSSVRSLAAAGASQTLANKSLAAVLEATQEQLKEAEHSIVELKQSVTMWQDLSQTLRDENCDLAAQVQSHVTRSPSRFIVPVLLTCGHRLSRRARRWPNLTRMHSSSSSSCNSASHSSSSSLWLWRASSHPLSHTPLPRHTS